jgi:CBS domain-containing protein
MVEDRVGQVMSKPVRTVEAGDQVGAALAVMEKNDIGNVVVVKGQDLVGIVTERDIVRHIVKETFLPQRPVNEIMAKPVITATPNMTVQEAVELMIKNNIHQLPVLEESRLVGIVTDKDLMRSVLRVSYEKLTRPNLREFEIEAARMAAQIVTLLNL